MAVYSNQLFRSTSTTGFATLGANTFTATQTITPAANTNALAVTGYSLTGTNAQSLLDLAGTLNTSGNPDVLALRVSVTAAGGTATLFNVYGGSTGTTSFFSVNTGGNVLMPAAGAAFSGGVQVGSGGGFKFSSVAAPTGSSSDLLLVRDAAGILAQRNGTTAQTFRLYNTFTDASNYERGVFDWGTTANTLTIGPQAAGTGTLRGVSAIGTWSFANAVMHTSSIALTNGAGAQVATMTNGPTAGNPTKWVPINDNGTTRYIPAW